MTKKRLKNAIRIVTISLTGKINKSIVHMVVFLLFYSQKETIVTIELQAVAKTLRNSIDFCSCFTNSDGIPSHPPSPLINVVWISTCQSK